MQAKNLDTVDIKAFVPARDFALSKRFYQALGFTLASEFDGVAYFHYGDCSFLLQNFYVAEFADNLMMQLLVENVDDWYAHVQSQGVAEAFEMGAHHIEIGTGIPVTHIACTTGEIGLSQQSQFSNFAF